MFAKVKAGRAGPVAGEILERVGDGRALLMSSTGVALTDSVFTSAIMPYGCAFWPPAIGYL